MSQRDGGEERFRGDEIGRVETRKVEQQPLQAEARHQVGHVDTEEPLGDGILRSGQREGLMSRAMAAERARARDRKRAGSMRAPTGDGAGLARAPGMATRRSREGRAANSQAAPSRHARTAGPGSTGA